MRHDTSDISQRGIRRRARVIIPGLVTLLILAAAACGGGDEATATPTVPASEGTPTAVAATATPAPATSPTVPPSGGPAGTFVYATNVVETAVFDNSRMGAANSQLRSWGVLETPLRWDENNEIQNSLVESWSYDDSATVLTFNLKEGVEFQGGWGEMTSADWVYSLESQGAETSPRNYGITETILERWEAPDDYTFVMELKAPDLTFVPFFIVNETFGAYTIWSQARADQLGEEGQVTHMEMGTGPYRVTKWAAGDEAIMQSWTDEHHRKTPGFAELKVQAIADPATQVAALRSGTVDVITLPITLASEVRDAGFDLRERAWGGNWSLRIGGLYYAKEFQGQPVEPRPGYDPTRAWIGNVNDPVSMENARKVREAMALAIDRDAIIDNLFEGNAIAMFAPEVMGPNRAEWEHKAEEWDYPYDPDRARALLTEAGLGGGFDVPFYLTTPPPDLGQAVFEAIIRDWNAVGIRAQAQYMTGGAFTSEQLTPRRFSGVWLSGGSGGAVRQVEAVRLCRLPTASYNQGHELPEALRLCEEQRNELDPQRQLDILEQNIEYHNHWKTIIPLWEQTNFLAFSDRIGDWPYSTMAETTFSDPEYAEPAQ